MTPSAVVEVRARNVKTRRIAFRYPEASMSRHFVGGDVVMSHIVTNLSAMFPEGEDFFVRSVRNYRDRIADPELKKQLAGFIGQEAMHGREHRGFNERLAAMGYTTSLVDRLTGIIMNKIAVRALPKVTQLAITAALEHYTATLAYVLLTDPEAQGAFETDEVRNMFLWHALEESEHKSVAFDVYQTVSGNHWRRTLAMDGVTVGFLVAVVVATIWSLLNDPAGRHPVRVLRNLWALRRSPFVHPRVLRHLRDYNRRGFHPDDHDMAVVLETWREEMFGAQGTLASRLRAAASAE